MKKKIEKIITKGVIVREIQKLLLKILIGLSVILLLKIPSWWGFIIFIVLWTAAWTWYDELTKEVR